MTGWDDAPAVADRLDAISAEVAAILDRGTIGIGAITLDQYLALIAASGRLAQTAERLVRQWDTLTADASPLLPRDGDAL